MGYLNPIQLAMLIIVGMLLVVADAHSAPGTYWGEYHVGSRHSTAGYYENGQFHKWNENNTGGGISYEVTDNFEVGAGFFKNSYSNHSFYAGVDFHTSSYRYLRAGISLAPITGYKDTPQGNRFMVLPNIVMQTGKVRTKVGILPGDVTLVTLTVGVAF